ncbi:MAG: hypothetical protein R3C28_28595 [Pirellulaceae bacterium]
MSDAESICEGLQIEPALFSLPGIANTTLSNAGPKSVSAFLAVFDAIAGSPPNAPHPHAPSRTFAIPTSLAIVNVSPSAFKTLFEQ